MRRVINLVGEVYLDVLVDDFDGEIEIEDIEEMTFCISNKGKGKGGSISDNLLKYRNPVTGETPADRIDILDLHDVIKRHIELETEEDERTKSEDRAYEIKHGGFW